MAPRTAAAAAAADSSTLLFFARFCGVKEPRRHRHKIVYPLELLLLIVFGAALSDMPGWQGAADFAELKEGWLRGLSPWDEEAPPPSADTIERVIGMLDAQEFAESFGAWMRDIAARRGTPESGALQQVTVDGKALGGAKASGAPTCPMTLVHTFLVDGRDGLLVGLAPAEGGSSGEGAAAEGVLALLALKGTVVTGDANFLSQRVVQTVVEGGGECQLALKGNRAPQYAEVEARLLDARGALDEAAVQALCASHFDAGEEAGHGRAEWRRAWALPIAHFPRVHAYLPRFQSVLVLRRERMPLSDGRYSDEVHFWVSTLPPSQAQAMAGYVRAHWGIENLLHRHLDVVLHEDGVGVRAGPGAQNLAVVRRAALAVLKADTSFEASLPRRVRKAAHDDAYRTHLLSLQIS